MYAEDETELRDLIIQNLETNGFINKIKAEIRAGVILALEEEGNFKSKVPFFNKKLEDFIATSEGKTMLSIVREFLEYFNLHFTLSVFDPEVANTYSFLNRDELINQLNIDNKDFEGPILKAFLKSELTPKIALVSHASEEINKMNDSVKTTEINLKTPELDPSNSLEPNFNDMFLSSKMEMSDIFPTSEIKITDTFTTSETKVSDALTTSKLKITDNSVSSESQISEALMASDVKVADHDPFFDEPLPTQKPSFFTLDEKPKENKVQLEKLPESDMSSLEKSNLSSLKNLPSFVTKLEWPTNKSKTLPSLDPLNLVKKKSVLSNLQMDKDIFDNTEANEDVSDEQINSEESIEEEIEEDFSNSAGIEDLLNSSLSLADDATTDQSISNVSVVEEVDHIEDCKTLN